MIRNLLYADGVTGIGSKLNQQFDSSQREIGANLTDISILFGTGGDFYHKSVQD